MMLFIYRLLINLLKLFFISLPLTLIGMILLLLYLPIQRYLYPTIHRLPYVLRFFDNADMYINRDVTTYTSVYQSSFISHYVWLAIRNPTNYFNYRYLGFQWLGNEEYILYINPEDIDNKGGYRHIELNNGYYEYYWVFKLYCKWFIFRMGYKIGDKNNPVGSYTQDVFVLH